MIRNYIYDNKTFKKYKSTDLSVKQEGSVERFIYEESDLIYTDKIGYPQFYTQLMFKKDSPITSLDWDLTNFKSIPVAGGVYLIHVDVPGIGERVLKFFGGMRQVDLQGI